MALRAPERRSHTWAWLILAAILAAIGSYVVWARTPATPLPQAYLAVNSDEVIVLDHPWLTVMPLIDTPRTGVIFYPGARVDIRAYAPYAEELALQGYLVVIVPMPLNLAILGGDKATDVMAVHPKIDTWVIAGHSLGGAMAARYAAQHPDAVDGLLLWAAYPASNDDLSASTLPVMSIYATLDGLTTLDDIDASRTLLPLNTTFVAVEGGNHSGFGWYGTQQGDNEATIGRPLQARIITQATLGFLAELGTEN